MKKKCTYQYKILLKYGFKKKEIIHNKKCERVLFMGLNQTLRQPRTKH